MDEVKFTDEEEKLLQKRLSELGYMKIKLNLGCGSNIKKGWFNYDKYPVSDEVKYIDLNELPLPFPDNYADEILASHILEHLHVPMYDMMLELHRILKPNGILTVKLPINCNIVEHEKYRFNIYYFNPILDNPVGEIAIRKKTSGQEKPLFHLLSVKKIRNYRNVLFRKRLGGEGDEIVGYKKDIILFLKHLPHRIYDMLFNGEIVWVMKAIKRGDK